MGDEGYSSEQIAAYGATAQPAIAARMTPHLRMTFIGAVCRAGGRHQPGGSPDLSDLQRP